MSTMPECEDGLSRADSLWSFPSELSVGVASTMPAESKKRKRDEEEIVAEREEGRESKRSRKITAPAPAPRAASTHSSRLGVPRGLAVRIPKKPVFTKPSKARSHSIGGQRATSGILERRYFTLESLAVAPPPPPSASVEEEAELLAFVEVKKTFMYGPKGDQVPREVTARLEVFADKWTTCRTRYVAAFYFGDYRATDDRNKVAEVAGHLIEQDGEWKKELLHLDTQKDCTSATENEGDDRFECARVVKTLVKPDGSDLWPEVNDFLHLRGKDVMHIAVVRVMNDHQKKGLMRPVLKTFRELICHQSLKVQGNHGHEGLLLLAPGKFNDMEKSACWGNMTDLQVSVKLSEMYSNADGYEMVVKQGKHTGFQTTVMGRYACDSKQAEYTLKKRSSAPVMAAHKKAGKKTPLDREIDSLAIYDADHTVSRTQMMSRRTRGTRVCYAGMD